MTSDAGPPAAQPVPEGQAHGLGAGAEFAGYQVVGLIGAGSLGSVYSAVDEHGSAVALKIFALANSPSNGLSAPDQAAFERETALNRRLAHPNIVKMMDAGVDRGRAYIAMELVAGTSLASFTRGARLLPLTAVLGICAKVADALAHAHRLGIVHRDVKPQNILLDHPGQTVKLADFGIATLGDTFRTQTGIVPGTPVYMSPEQLCGGLVDARTDLYALGAVLFESMAGRYPHSAASLGALLRQVATQDAPALSDLHTDVPQPVSDLVASLLARQPARRPNDAQVIAEALRGLAQSIDQPDRGPKSRG